MPTPDYKFEDFISRTDKSLKDSSLVNEIIATEDVLFNKIHTELLLKTFSSYNSENIILDLDGYVDINISRDSLIVKADFYPPSEGKKPINFENTISQIEKKNIKYGIKTEIIRDSIYKCNTERIILKEVIIAEGRRSKDEIFKYIKLNENITEKKLNPEDEDKVDFREYKNYKVIKKGELLASVIPLRKGLEGINVYGDIIPYSRKKKKSIIPGKNTLFSDDNIIASCEGIFKYDGISFWIEKVFIINSDVDYKTGNIDYSGDVILEGKIKDTFKIKARGDIYCSQTLDASEVTGEGHLYVKNGIIGRSNGIVKINKTIRTKFIEHCCVEAEDSIYLTVGAINSYIYTNNKIITSHKGLLIGGTIYAANGIIATQIGSAMGPKTEIYCGTDFNVSNKMEWVKDKTIELATKLQEVRKIIKKDKTSNTQKEILEKYENQIQGAIHKLNEASIQLLGKIDKNSEADIIVRGSIYPGTYIEICHVSYIVPSKMTKVRIRLDKKKGKITIDRIGYNEIRGRINEYSFDSR